MGECACVELRPDGAVLRLLEMFGARPGDVKGVAVCGLEACGKNDGGKTEGLCEGNKVHVSDALPPGRRLEVLLHELCHCVIDRLGRDRRGRDFRRLRRTRRGTWSRSWRATRSPRPRCMLWLYIARL
jgi:hypothetical protein